MDMRVANNKRDVYSELSYLTHAHKLGPDFLRWVYGLITDENYAQPKWWMERAPILPLCDWMMEWQDQHLPKEVWGVSGLY